MIKKFLFSGLMGILTILIISKFIGIKDLKNIFLNLNPYIISLSIGIILITLIIDAIRLKVLAHYLNYKIPIVKAFENILLGSFFSLITPFSLGGQPIQILHLSKMGIPTSKATNIIVSRTLVTSFTTQIFGILFIYPIFKALPNNSLSVPILLLSFSISLALAFLISLAFFKIEYSEKLLKIGLKLLPTKKREKIIKNFDSWILNLKNSTKELWNLKRIALIFDLFLWIIYMLIQPLSLFIPLKLLCDYKINYFYTVGIFIILNIIIFYIPTPGASGGIESLYYIFFSQIVMSSEPLLKSIFTWRIASYYFPLILGYIYSIKLSSKKEVKIF